MLYLAEVSLLNMDSVQKHGVQRFRELVTQNSKHRIRQHVFGGQVCLLYKLLTSEGVLVLFGAMDRLLWCLDTVWYGPVHCRIYCP